MGGEKGLGCGQIFWVCHVECFELEFVLTINFGRGGWGETSEGGNGGVRETKTKNEEGKQVWKNKGL